MARRRRLEIGEGDGGAADAPETKSAFPMGVARTRTLSAAPPPVSRVAGEASAAAALAEVAGEMTRARDEGRMVVRLPLDAVDPGHIARDRQRLDPDEMAALEASLEAHGQRTPVEAVETAPGRYGLISGWRRLSALSALRDRTGEARFGEVLALLRRPADAGAAYVAMVEENEIRANLGHWERAGIVIRTVADGVFPDEEAAIGALFGAVSRARRSKIRTFVGLHHRLGDALRFGPDLIERTGLALSGRIADEAGFEARLAARLAAAAPATAEAERALLEAALAEPMGRAEAGSETSDRSVQAFQSLQKQAPGPAPGPTPGPSEDGGLAIRLSGKAGRLTLAGPGVTDDFRRALAAWLEDYERG